MGYVPSGRGPELIAIYIVFLALSTITIALRCYVRLFMMKIFGWDDIFAVISWVCFAFWGSFAITGAYHGTGQHATLIEPPTEIPIGLKWWWSCEPVYVLSTMAIKISIGLMLLRLVVEKTHKWLIWIVVGVTQLYSVGFFFLFIFQCSPPKFFWTRLQGDTNGSCMDPKVTVDATYVFSALTVVCDLTLAILPYFLVRKLQMNSRTKFMVAIILALGSIASAATIVRLPYIHTLSNMADFLYATTDVAIWSCCETGLSIVASSAATLKPLFKDFLSRSKFFGGSSSLPMTNRDTWSKNKASGASAGGKYVRTHSLEGGGSRTDTDGDSTTNITKTMEVDVRHMGTYEER